MMPLRAVVEKNSSSTPTTRSGLVGAGYVTGGVLSQVRRRRSARCPSMVHHRRRRSQPDGDVKRVNRALVRPPAWEPPRLTEFPAPDHGEGPATCIPAGHGPSE